MTRFTAFALTLLATACTRSPYIPSDDDPSPADAGEEGGVNTPPSRARTCASGWPPWPDDEGDGDADILAAVAAAQPAGWEDESMRDDEVSLDAAPVWVLLDPA